ncbi:YibE/F family protein [Patescibacteria group bacterium]
MKKFLLTIICCFTAFSFIGNTAFAQPVLPIQEMYVKGQVNEVKEERLQIHADNPLYDPQKEDPQYQRIQQVTYELLEGEYKGIIFQSENEIMQRIFDLDLKKGSKVLVLLQIYEDGAISGFATDYIRNNTMIIFIALFVIALLLIGKLKGLRALLSLAITIGAIFYILIPMTAKGYDPLIIAVLISIGVTIVTITLIAGFNRKGVSAIIGTLGGVFFAALIAYIVGKVSMLTGLSGEDARILYVNKPGLNFYHIFFASIIIGALGAIMDVGMSIASSVHEIAEASSNKKRDELFKAGMNVGKDIMGTMSNTLILAYVGSALPLLILFSMNDFGTMQVINFDFIAAEIVRSISGSFGLLLAIPITAFAGAFLVSKKSH